MLLFEIYGVEGREVRISRNSYPQMTGKHARKISKIPSDCCALSVKAQMARKLQILFLHEKRDFKK